MEKKAMQHKYVTLLSIGHMVTDVNQGALPAMLPFFISAHDLSYAAAGGIVFAMNIASTIVQPLFGHWADRFSKPWLLPVGLLLAGLGLSLTGLTASYSLIVLLAVVSGVGIAAYHPEAARLVNFSSGTQKGLAMSIFGAGGMMGFAVGPILASSLLISFGLKGALALVAPVAIMCLIMATQLNKLASVSGYRLDSKKVATEAPAQEAWAPFARLTLSVITRSILFYGLITFVPLYWINVLGQSKASGATALAIMSGASVLGNLMGGKFADRYGHIKVMVIGYGLLIFLLPALVWVTSTLAATLLLIPVGMALASTHSPSIVMGQRYLPNRVGFSSGITIGVAVAVGGIATPVIGKIADIYGMWTALASISLLPAVAAALAFTLPDPDKLAAQVAKKELSMDRAG